jgi:hypothetical protein
MTNCHSLRDSLASHLNESMVVSESGDLCIITLPIPTLDGRLVDVCVERKLGDYFVVHDGGKAVNELILQGVDLTDSISTYMESLAKRFQVSYSNESFTVTIRQSQLTTTIFSIGMCSSLAMGQLIGNIGSLPEEPVRKQFGTALRKWAHRRAKISSDVPVKGRRVRHRFDFLAKPRRYPDNMIALSVLLPGSDPLAAAQRFGFIAADLDQTPFAKWPKVAVEGRAEAWSSEAKSILRNCADVVIEIPTQSAPTSELIGEKLRALMSSM